MRNMMFSNTTRESDGLIKNTGDSQNLNNKYAAKRLFRYCYYNLIAGEMSVLENVTNRRFLEKIIDVAESESDIHLLPALNKIAGNTRLDEGIRQNASAVSEQLEEQYSGYKQNRKPRPPDTEAGRIAYAKEILAATRQPQTTEILRLLRDKSVEVKRLGLYIIRKFSLNEMSQEVCECLNNPSLATDAYYVLQAFGRKAGDDLQRFYLMSSGNITISKIVLRLLGKTCAQEFSSFLLSLLWSVSRQIKEIALKSLTECKLKVPEEEKEHLYKLISETGEIITWILSAKICLEKNNDTSLLYEANKEYIRWEDFLDGLVSITYNIVSGERGLKSSSDKKNSKGDLIPEWIHVIIDESFKTKTGIQRDNLSDKKKLGKLKKYFPMRIPQYEKFYEFIINCDYNLISIWTKVCAIRNISEIDNEDLAESIVALLFSPEEILREEAARLIAQSGKELYKTTSERLTDLSRQRVDRIISGGIHEKELLYEKVKFLSACFAGIPEDELLFLASNMILISVNQTETVSYSDGYIAWVFRKGRTDNDVHIFHEESDKKIALIRSETDFDYCYLLPLVVVEEFNLQFAERSFEILKYIDTKEE